LSEPTDTSPPRVTRGAERPTRSLGIGLPYFASLPPDVYRSRLVDFVEVTPETISREQGKKGRAAITLVPDQLERAQKTCAGLPMVVHGVELSIGSAHGWNSAYLDMLDTFQSTWSFIWHSEHLGFQTVLDDEGTSVEVGVPLPLPATEEAMRVVAERCTAIRCRYGVPFLLENPAYYVTGLPADPELRDDAGLMCAITEHSECYQLLDLHNVYCNAVNHQLDPRAIIKRMPLDRVVEIHVAGGSWHNGIYMDAHDGRVPDVVWELLDYTLPRTPNIAGVVFELLEEHALRLGVDGVAAELTRASEIWRRWGLSEAA